MPGPSELGDFLRGGQMAVQAAIAALLLSHTARIWELMVPAGAGRNRRRRSSTPASTALTPLTVSAGRLQEANALRGMPTAAMQFAGPALAGALIVTAGPGYALAIDAASFGVSAAASRGCACRRESAARTWVWLILVSASLGT